MTFFYFLIWYLSLWLFIQMFFLFSFVILTLACCLHTCTRACTCVRDLCLLFHLTNGDHWCKVRFVRRWGSRGHSHTHTNTELLTVMREAWREFKPIVIIECSSGVLGSSRLTKLPTQNLSEIPKRFMILLLWSWETNMDDGLLLLLIHSAVTVRIWGQISGITLKMKHLFNLHGCTETLTDSKWKWC